MLLSLSADAGNGAIDVGEALREYARGPRLSVSAAASVKLFTQSCVLQDFGDSRGELRFVLPHDDCTAPGFEHELRTKLGRGDDGRALRHRFEQNQPLCLGA